MAIATKILAAADWSLAGSWGGSTPVDGERVSIPASLNANVIMSLSEVDIALAALYTHPQFTRDFGASGSPLAISSVKVRHRGSGNFYFDCADDGATTGFVTDCIIDPSNRDALIELGSIASPLTGTYQRISLLNGRTTLQDDILFHASAVVNVQQSSDVARRTVCIAGSSVPTIPTFNHRSGLSKLSNVVTALNVAGGECIKESNKALTVNVFGGVLKWRHKTVSGDAVSITVHDGGVLDLIDESGDPKTITLLVRKPGGIIHHQADLHEFTTFIDEEEK